MATRRRFLLDCSTVAVTASFVPAEVFSGPLRSRQVSLDQISFSAFEAQLNTVFVVRSAAGPSVKLALIHVEALTPHKSAPANAEDAQNEKFSLVFAGPRNQPLGQDTYTFEHSGLGEFEMFIANIGVDDSKRYYYEATFNRPQPGTSGGSIAPTFKPVLAPGSKGRPAGTNRQ
jgi:hypothetical protein